MLYFFESFAEKIDIYIVGLVLLSGFFQKKYLAHWCWYPKDGAYDSALKTLAVSAIVCTIYIILLKDPNRASNWVKYFISYFMATSIYELLVDKFIDWITNKFSKQTK